MDRSVHSEQLPDCVSDLQVEIVERKGIGHPDSIIDGACEAVSIALSKYYLGHFDVIFHHNVDKGLLVGGKSQAVFGGGKVRPSRRRPSRTTSEAPCASSTRGSTPESRR